MSESGALLDLPTNEPSCRRNKVVPSTVDRVHDGVQESSFLPLSVGSSALFPASLNELV